MREARKVHAKETSNFSTIERAQVSNDKGMQQSRREAEEKKAESTP
jgi:hypothetical protein